MKNFIKWFAVLAMAITLLGMVGSPVSAGQQGERFLPYRVGVPAGRDILYPPAPYNRARHGLALPNTQPGANMVDRPGVVLPEREAPLALLAPVPNIPPGSGDRGLWLTAGSGIYAANDAQLNLVLPDDAIGTTIYAPTHMSAGGTCIEATTAHWRYPGMSGTAHGLGFWDWCATDGTGGWQVFEFMDSSWLSKYVRRLNGEPKFWVQVYSDAPMSWKALLYNFELGQWEEKTAITGTNVSGFGDTGWTMWESHYMMDGAGVCPNLSGIRASNMKIYVDGSWVPMGPSNAQDSLGPYGQCWLDGTYTFRLSPRWDSWQARTPKMK